MVPKRHLLGGVASLAALPFLPRAGSAQSGPQGSFESFLDGVRAEARRAGISPATLARALGTVQPNPRVVELDRRQPEGFLSWEEYRDRIMVNPTRVQNGQRNHAENRALLGAIEARYRVAPRVIVAIWGVETNFGGNTGGFAVIEALATLAWEGRRAEFFRKELLAALRVLDGGHVAPARMSGSWAGAMGQPQFMPTNFERMAVDFNGDGRRDIWDSKADALASIAHYFQKSGWREGEPWGRAVLPPPRFPIEGAEAEGRRTLRDWSRLGFRSEDGSPLPASELEAALVLPSRGAGQVFLGHHNLRVIRRYNSPVNYGLAVGLLSDRLG